MCQKFFSALYKCYLILFSRQPSSVGAIIIHILYRRKLVY